eukprot:CAMPEP_0202979370 /NCGR_PEP_ID=MMETSP1396-20130829/85542_1 /ASSEMBLY_ACC=CAM_ASM_000872 /TAXON_ID= /ORGANISM="Pseudokeronopsis sp., Strain Brazil" /LENGTH=133 /DNA_ID=CAMNT_0049718771 /DNA_START=329 /DNA_END=730 /DNA_ORIENTATION=+
MEDGLPVPPKNQGEFEKYFKQKLKDPFARYTYMRLISLEQFQQFMKEEFDCELLILILRTFQEQVTLNPSFLAQPEEQHFIAQFLLQVALQTPSFDFVLEFFSPVERQLALQVIGSLDLLAEEERERLMRTFK